MEEPQGVAVNLVLITSDREQRDVAVVERVNGAVENLISHKLGGTVTPVREDSVNAEVAGGSSKRKKNCL